MALLCCYCGAEIAWKKKRIVHVNICQKPSITYYCNQACKLNWIFKRPDLKFEKDNKSNWVNDEVESIFDMSKIEEKTDELEKYLKDNNLRILRRLE